MNDLSPVGILSDDQLCSLREQHPIIEPFVARQIRQLAAADAPFRHRSVISYGLSSHGYDVQLSDEGLRVFVQQEHKWASDFDGMVSMPVWQYDRDIDPHDFDVDLLHNLDVTRSANGSAYYTLDPNAYALGLTVETFDLPRDVCGVCVGKSTYARCGLIVNTTPLEAGWRGRLVIELKNATELPMRVYAGEGIAQVQFFASQVPCITSYADRDGKYQNQSEIVTARI